MRKRKKKHEHPGHPIHVEKVLQAQRLRAKGLKYREIMKLLDVKDYKTVYRWLRYTIGDVHK